MEKDNYYMLSSSIDSVENGMMLCNMPDLPNDLNDDWCFGTPFTEEPEIPIPVYIQEGYEEGTPLNYYDSLPVASNEFIEALKEAGVNNIITYDANLETEDDEVKHTGFKAFNLISIVKPAGDGNVYIGDKKLFSNSGEELGLAPKPVTGMLMFRITKGMGEIIIHESLKKHLESKGFSDLVYIDAKEIFCP